MCLLGNNFGKILFLPLYNFQPRGSVSVGNHFVIIFKDNIIIKTKLDLNDGWFFKNTNDPNKLVFL